MERDEEGELTYDPDEQSREGTPEPVALEDDWEEEGNSPSASQAPDSGDEETETPKEKPRKRLVKKSVVEAASPEEDERSGRYRSRDDGEVRKKVRKSKEGLQGKSEGKKRKSVGSTADKLARLVKGVSKGSGKQGLDHVGKKGEKEMKEMWDSVAGGDDSEEDKEGVPDDEDHNFIDDTGVEGDNRYISDGEAASAGEAPQAEEAEEEDEDELVKLFKGGKRRKKFERTPEEIAMFVEQFMAKLDVAAETDADLNRASKPAIEKLKMLPELLNVLEKRQLQQEFLDRGVLSSLKNWLEPLPDGSLPNINIRTALLRLLTDLPIDVELFERREQLKKSGLGKVVMFLSKLPEETPLNKKLSRDLVDKWSRPIFQKSTRYEDLRSYDEDRPQPRRTPVKKPISKPRLMERGDDLDMVHQSEEPKPGEVGYRQHASRPEALPLDFVRRPESKVNPDDVRIRAKQLRQDEKRSKMNKKLQQLKTPKKKNLQASKISVEGRGVVNYH